jgi:hypothetical protein
MTVTGRNSPASEFLADTAVALTACAKTPALPATTAVLTGVLALADTQSSSVIWLLVGLVVAVFLVGFSGTERVWFRRAFEGRDLAAGEVWSISWSCFGRFLGLGLLALIPVVILVGTFIVAGGITSLAHPGANYLLIGSVAVIDVLGTFISPAATFSSSQVGKAIGMGLRLLRETWPSCILYAFCPPLALQALAALTPSQLPLLAVTLAVLTALVSLVFKGATAAFYLRRAPQEPGAGEWAS